MAISKKKKKKKGPLVNARCTRQLESAGAIEGGGTGRLLEEVGGGGGGSSSAASLGTDGLVSVTYVEDVGERQRRQRDVVVSHRDGEGS